MFFRKMQDDNIYAPVTGQFIKLQDVNDTTFSSGLMGFGFGIEPDDSCVLSPYDGEVTMIFPTGHAIGLRRKDGLETLIHIGIETVNLNGRGFEICCSLHKKVKKGELLVRFDKELFEKEQLTATVIVVFTNSSSYDFEIPQESRYCYAKDVIGNAKKQS